MGVRVCLFVCLFLLLEPFEGGRRRIPSAFYVAYVRTRWWYIYRDSKRSKRLETWDLRNLN